MKVSVCDWLIAGLFLPATYPLSVQTTPPAPPLEFICELTVSIAPALTVGEIPHGTRRIIPITGGTF